MEEMLRIVDVLHREKDIDKELIFQGIELALQSAARKQFGKLSDVRVSIDRGTGAIHAEKDGEIVPASRLGRIAAQAAKQVIMQKIREAERDVIYLNYEGKVREIAAGVVQRLEQGNVIINLGRTEGILPREYQIRSELYKPGDRIRTLITSVEKQGQGVRIVLSRTHDDLVRRLFELEVPEISEKIIEIKVIVREPGYRTKVAVYSVDSRVDAVGACVGIRGSRIKNIVEELNGEKIDIIRWSDTAEILIGNSLKPAEASEIFLYPKTRRAEVVVDDDQLSLAIGRRGQNVRLAGRLCGWEIDAYTQKQMHERSTVGRKELSELPGMTDEWMGRFIEQGFGCWADIVKRGIDALRVLEGIPADRVQEMFAHAQGKQAEKVAAAAELARQAAAAAAAAAAEQAPPAQDIIPVPEPAQEAPAGSGEAQAVEVKTEEVKTEQEVNG
jgi:N utilization substance protein A